MTSQNLAELLAPLSDVGDLLLSVSVDVSSAALIAVCQERGALYLDTCIEPWARGCTEDLRAPASRTNDALREAALAWRGPHRGWLFEEAVAADDPWQFENFLVS